MWRKLNRMKTKSKSAQKQSSYTRDKLWSRSWQFCERHHYLSCSLDTEFVTLVHTGALALGDIWQLVYHSTNNSGHLELPAASTIWPWKCNGLENNRIKPWLGLDTKRTFHLQILFPSISQLSQLGTLRLQISSYGIMGCFFLKMVVKLLTRNISSFCTVKWRWSKNQKHHSKCTSASHPLPAHAEEAIVKIFDELYISC